MIPLSTAFLERSPFVTSLKEGTYLAKSGLKNHLKAELLHAVFSFVSLELSQKLYKELYSNSNTAMHCSQLQTWMYCFYFPSSTIFPATMCAKIYSLNCVADCAEMLTKSDVSLN